jgi:thiamine-monophosphate kinase
MKPRRSAPGRTRLKDLGEDLLLARLLRSLPRGKQLIAGPGDDVAIVRPSDRRELLVLKTDCVVERVHFRMNATPETIGWKAMMRPLSDFAAVSAVPEFALITLMVNKTREVRWVEAVYRGLRRAASRFKVQIVGGETSATPGPAAISVSVSGRVERRRWVSRSGGRAGDHLFVSGRLGNSLAGKHLRFVPRITESRWLTANFRIHAMMDLSDGLGADLPRLARASRVGFEIDKTVVPREPGVSVEHAINDGEDYELLFALAPNESQRLQTAWRRKFPRLKLTRIGVFHRESNIANRNSLRGYVHFQ